MAQKMTQTQAVIETIRQLGGVATLTQINQNIFNLTDCKWGTKTPFASIRAIVQRTPSHIYKIKPGLYGLVEFQKRLEEDGFVIQTEENRTSKEIKDFNHTYYQGLLLEIGNRQQLLTFSPNQDKNKKFAGNKTLGEIRNISELPIFAPQKLVKRAETIDVIWLNGDNDMPEFFFEVEHSTDIQNSLLKYNELCGLNARMIIVADVQRLNEYEKKKNLSAFKNIRDRVEFLDYKSLEKQYELLLEYQTLSVGILGI